MSSKTIPRSRVALIGRPNVGKSTLFNILTRTRKALVRNEPGVTRDIQVQSADWWGTEFDVVDTGGITESREGFSPLIRKQVLGALENMDLLLVVMDGKAGLVPEDRDIIRIAKESGKPFLLIVNKMDRYLEAEKEIGEFYEFGMDLIPTSFEMRIGVDQIVEWIQANLPEKGHTTKEGVRIVLFGKPNVGKSSLCNALLNSDRMIVSATAGTTVDAIEEEFEFNCKPYVLVDTAGLRRQSKRKEGVEYISAHMTVEAASRADIVLLLVDATEGPTVQEAKMVEQCLHMHKAIIIVANKTDLARKENSKYREKFQMKVYETLRFFPDVPVVYISALTRRGLNELMEKVDEVYEKLHTKISTSKLNKFFYEVIRKAPSPVYATKDVKFYYLTQTEQVPPSFIAFANQPEGVTPSYRKFIAKQLAQEFDLQGIPIRIFALPSGGGSREAET